MNAEKDSPDAVKAVSRFRAPEYGSRQQVWDTGEFQHTHRVADETRNFIEAISSLRLAFDKVITPVRSYKDAADGAHAQFVRELHPDAPASVGVETTRHPMPLSKQTSYLNMKRTLDSAHHADRNLPRYFLLGLVSHYDAFLNRLIRGLFAIKPDLRKATSSSLTADELLRCNDLAMAEELLLEKTIEDAMRGGHVKQLQWIEQRLGITTLRKFVSFRYFVELTERRNLVAHNDGAVTNRYLAKVQSSYSQDMSTPYLEVGADVVVDDAYLNRAYEVLFEVGVKLAQVTWRKVRPDEIPLADDVLSGICYSLLVFEQFDLAMTLLTFAVDLPKHSSEHVRRKFVINLAQCYKWLGDVAGCTVVLDKEDWSAAEDAFTLARLVLADDFDSAGGLMKTLARNHDIPRRAFHDWPLFRTFRMTQEFAAAYLSVYHEPFMND